MPHSPQSSTRRQRDEALQALQLLNIAIQNIVEVTLQTVHHIFDGAINNGEETPLTITPQVVTGLSTLQAAVSDLSRAYISHTNAVLGKGTSVSFDQIAFTNPLAGENGLFSARVPTPAPAVEQPAEGKKRKRAPHDKNAPKRALTPFFLYLQSQRTTIGKELGDKFTAKEIQDEGGRRWREMPDKEKSVSLYCSLLLP